jgi:hypothetical protein
MCSFQEMTTQQVTDYVDRMAQLGCTRLYSLNRDHSKHNPELSLVSTIVGGRYDLTPIALLPTEYCSVGAKLTKAKAGEAAANNPSTYRHFAGNLRAKAARAAA